MCKEMDCINYFPGVVRKISGRDLSTLLLRDGRNKVKVNEMWLGGKGDNQRRTEWYYIYANDNLLGGK